MIEVFEALANRIKLNEASVLVTIIEMKGSTPGKVGFKMLVGSDGRIAGTVGGGGVEFYAINKCKELFQSDQFSLKETLVMKDSLLGEKSGNLEVKKNDDVAINALCGGEVTLFFEVYKPAKMIYVFGAGHVGQAIIRLAKQMNYFISVFDNRQNVLDEIPEDICNEKKCLDLPNLHTKEKSYITLDPGGYVIIVTHNHSNDLQVFEYLYRNYPDQKYIGMIGSKRKVHEGISFIKKKLNGEINLSNLYSPVGIDLGGDSPNEIAVSVLAEIQAVTYGKTVNHLRLNYDDIK
ncbi:MAG: XdhC family protein [Bacteroidetes bacterium]|nr:XdhC family protein [Bacteroidota bacterium]